MHCRNHPVYTSRITYLPSVQSKHIKCSPRDSTPSFRNLLSCPVDYLSSQSMVAADHFSFRLVFRELIASTSSLSMQIPFPLQDQTFSSST